MENAPPRGARPQTARARLGSSGERVAAHWLEARGYRLLARNWRCPWGELDLIAEHEGEVVFIEIKTRRGQAMGAPEESITPTKRRHLLAAAQSYLAEHATAEAPYRIDVVAVQLSPTGTLEAVRHYCRAIAEDE